MALQFFNCFRHDDTVRPMDHGILPTIRFTSYAFFKYQNGQYDYSTFYPPALDRAVERAMNNYRGEMLILDIEHWVTDIRIYRRSDVQSTIAKIAEILDYLRELIPGVRLGLYGEIPTRDYWHPILPNSSDSGWKLSNEFMKPLSTFVDFICPSLYTFEDDLERWIKYARANIDQARIYEKPIYAFLWRRYTRKDETVSWVVKQMRLCKEEAIDGIMLFGNQRFGASDSWWQKVSGYCDTLNTIRDSVVQPQAIYDRSIEN